MVLVWGCRRIFFAPAQATCLLISQSGAGKTPSFERLFWIALYLEVRLELA